jgi:hypothetical protein
MMTFESKGGDAIHERDHQRAGSMAPTVEGPDNEKDRRANAGLSHISGDLIV